jgi:RNA polymerase sigma factor (sigma-70 family)
MARLPQDVTDEALMETYCQGDEDAFRLIFERYALRLQRVLRRQVPSDEDAKELVQQTFLHLHRARKDFRHGMSLRPWLFTICLNLKREHFRRKQRRPEVLVDVHDERGDRSAPPHDPVQADVSRRLRGALGTLPPNQREVIELHWFDGLPFGEVAQVVGASVSAVKVRAHRGYVRLRAVLGDEWDRNHSGAAAVRVGEDP